MARRGNTAAIANGVAASIYEWKGRFAMSEDRRLRKQMVLNATREQVWEAIATRRGIAAWFGQQEEEPGQDGKCIFGSVTAWEPGRRLAARGPAAGDGSAHTFEFQIDNTAGGSTLLQFVHSGFQGDDWRTQYEITSKGWEMYFQTLAQYLTHFPGRAATFVAAEGPPASAREPAWDVLLAGLGLTGEAREGDRVLLTLDGLPPIDGILDYLDPAGRAAASGTTQPAFLGVRTADALYRFHGRAALGATLAVGHHIFDDDLDVAKVQNAWQSWLQRPFTGMARIAT